MTYFSWHARVACLFFIQVGVTLGSPQQPIYATQNGVLRPLNNPPLNCGVCPQGSQREVSNGPYCGRCVPTTQTCANGNVMVNGQCQSCPCPDTSGSRKFGTSCHVDVDGQVTCECPDGYIGRNCDQCAPGTVQNNQYPYNCLRVNSTNSFSVTCPAGNICNPPPITQLVRQPRSIVCPITGTGQQLCPTTTVVRTPPWTVSQPICPGPVACPVQQVQTVQQVQPVVQQVQPVVQQVQPVVQQVRPVVQTNPCPVVSCPQTVQTVQAVQPVQTVNPCPVVSCPQTVQTVQAVQQVQTVNPCPVQQCPVQTVQPVNPCPVQQCPVQTIQPVNPCPVQQCPVQQVQQCPQIYPCPQAPVCPPAPQCPPCPVTQCPQCPVTQCPPIQPCPQCPPPVCPPTQCPQCPAPLPCPQCPITNCPQCPNVQCPNPCSPCPSPCRDCPSIPPCPTCPQQCPNCVCNTSSIVDCRAAEVCICDPRGTASQAGDECICKVNVQGARCDQPKPGYFGLSSTRAEGALACFCSGLSTSCSLTAYYKTVIETYSSSNCSSIELTDDRHSIVYSKGSSGFSWDGKTAIFSKSVSSRLFWSLPSCLKGDRVTSYGGILSFSRMCSGSGSPLGGDHEVIIVSSSGATIFWTAFDQQKCDGKWVPMEVLLAETAYWSTWKGEVFRRATRADIMEVLADIQLILVRATFTTNTQTVSIAGVSLETVTNKQTSLGIALEVESCRCPTGYRGHSCESCAPGYYRDITDMSHSVFGACRPCPCGGTADGCHLSSGQVVCICKPGFTGPLCQDKETITVTCDPFYIRVADGTDVDFTCSFTSNSKRELLLRLGLQGSMDRAVQTTTLTKTITLIGSGARSHIVDCEVVDSAGYVWATVHCKVEVIANAIVIRAPPPRIIAVIPRETFICVNETERVDLVCDVHHFGPSVLSVEWRKEGSASLLSNGNKYSIPSVTLDDAGTYICSVSDGQVTGASQIALMVRRISMPMRIHYPVNGTGSYSQVIFNRHGGDYPNYPYQADDSGNAQQTQTKGEGDAPSQKISPVAIGHPKAVVEPTQIVAKPGDTVVLRCNATGEEPLKFYWKSGSNDYIPAHVRMSHGALVFRSLKSQDAGVYYCVAWNHVGQSTARATILLDNSQPPTPVETAKFAVQVDRPEITARPGENVNFQCKSNNQTGVSYNWSRVGAVMPSSSEIRNDDGLLTLYRVSDKDQGAYLCTATSAQGGQTGSAQGVLRVQQADGKLCRDKEFRCKSGDQCIPREKRCNKARDCKDGSDEDNCRSKKTS